MVADGAGITKYEVIDLAYKKSVKCINSLKFGNIHEC